MEDIYRNDDQVCMVLCAWMGESGTFLKALGGFWGSHACAEISIRRGWYSEMKWVYDVLVMKCGEF